MQSTNRKLQKQTPQGQHGAVGDYGVSFYSQQSSFMDSSSMMETSGIGYYQHKKKMEE